MFGLTNGATARGTLGSGTQQAPTLDLKGNTIIRDLISQWKLEGRVYIANRGTASTPISFAKTAYDEDQPQFVVNVPAGIVIVPIHLEVTFEDMAGTDNEIIWGCTTNDVGSGTSTAVTPTNLRVGGGNNSGCSVRRDYTGNATAATGLFEFYRAVYAFADATTDPVKRFVVDQAAMPIVRGAGSLQLWVAAVTTAPAGYATAIWAEFTAAELGL